MELKRIGIMSMQRIVNYGSFLQAYSLKKNIEEITKKKVEFVDYNVGNSIVDKKNVLLNKIKKNMNIIKFYKKRKYVKKLNKAYTNNFLPLLGINEKNYYPSNIESLVIGSDEVFNCLQTYPVGFSLDLFGNNYENINLISYAGSFGFVKYEDIKKHKIDKILAESFKKFREISVRDENSAHIINALIGKKPVTHLDPVLITSLDKEMVDNVKYSDFILVYAYSNRINKEESKIIKEYAKKMKKTIISIGGYQEFADHNLVVNPFELYAYFQKAYLVITDTFHGSIFSIKTHANYYTIVRKSNENKIVDMLTKLGQSNRMISDINRIFVQTKNDFSLCDRIIEEERKKSIEYLTKCL